MPKTLSIEKMSTQDKLRAMEELWVSLTAAPDSFESPAWHRDALEETEKRVSSGEEEFIDWDEAKRSLRRRAK